MSSTHTAAVHDAHEQIFFTREAFTTNNQHLEHLKINEDSGMGSWLQTAGTSIRTWIGVAPIQCTVAYNPAGRAVGWCALGYYRRGIDVIGTYVEPSYRYNGIGALLVEQTLRYPNDGQTIIAYDDIQWNIIHLIRKANLQGRSFCDLSWLAQATVG